MTSNDPTGQGADADAGVDTLRPLARPFDARESRFSLVPWKPRWRPWAPARVIATALGFAVVFGCLIVSTLRVTKRWAVATRAPLAAMSVQVPAVIAPAPREPSADEKLDREGRSPLAGGLLMVPPSFASADGKYDLVIHLHGNTDLVEESFALAKLNAVVVTLNLGAGSGHYEDRFANPLGLPEMIDRVQTTMAKRGLARASLRRVALSAWSAGYGGILKILEQPALFARIDAVLLLDGIHAGYRPGTHEIAVEKLAPFVRFAEEAVAGRKLFSITHTRITPAGSYAGTHETTDALLAAVGVPRVPGGEEPALPALRSIDGVIARKLLRPLSAEATAHREGLIVRAFQGDQPEDHMAHLLHMGVTVVPDLIAWWTRRAPAEGGSARTRDR